MTRDQINIAIGQLTRARHELNGIESYVWRTTGDERLCPYPRGEQRPDVRLGQPALRYRPLWPDTWCRCTAQPVYSEVKAA